MKKTVFKGELNGVEFTDEAEFNKVLKHTKEEDVKSVSVKKEVIEETAEDSETNGEAKEEKIADFSTLFKQVFDSWKDIFSNIPDAETQKKVEQKFTPMSVQEVLDNFLFKPTTYEFTGGEQDEIELDKFDSLLHKKRIEFSAVDNSGFTYEDEEEIIKAITKEYVRVGKLVKDIETELKDYEYKIDKFIEVISACKELNINYKDYELQQAELQHKFDVEINRKFYNELLHIYYRDLTNIFYK